MKRGTICHISFNHSPFDDRIYWKEMLSLKEAGYNPIHIAVDDANADYVTKDGIRIITVKRKKKHVNKWINKFIQLVQKKNTTIESIYRKAKSVNALVYHYHDLQINSLIKRLKNLPQNPKVIYDAHEAFHLLMLEDMPKNKIKKILYKTYVKIVAKWELYHASNCDCIIATDEYTLTFFRKQLPKVKSQIVFNYSFFKVRNDLSQNKKFDFIYSGLMTPNRGIENIIRSVFNLKQKLSFVKLLLIGNFDSEQFKDHILYLIQKLDLAENIFIENAVPFDQISVYYCQAAIGLGLFQKTPKYNTFIPIKLFEYMAFGLPVIFSNHGPASKIINDTNCGLLVDYFDIEMTSDAMFQLLNNKRLYDELSKNGMNAVENQFNWVKEKNKLLAIYDELFN